MANGETTGSRVRAERKKLGLTQEQLAVKAGLTVQTLARIENDRYTRRTVGTFVSLAKVFGVRVGYLLEGDPPGERTA